MRVSKWSRQGPNRVPKGSRERVPIPKESRRGPDKVPKNVSIGSQTGVIAKCRDYVGRRDNQNWWYDNSQGSQGTKYLVV